LCGVEAADAMTRKYRPRSRPDVEIEIDDDAPDRSARWERLIAELSTADRRLLVQEVTRPLLLPLDPHARLRTVREISANLEALALHLALAEKGTRSRRRGRNKTRYEEHRI
jgi:hypothetical protein